MKRHDHVSQRQVHRNPRFLFCSDVFALPPRPKKRPAKGTARPSLFFSLSEQSDLAKENLDRVAASADQLKDSTGEDAGFLWN